MKCDIVCHTHKEKLGLQKSLQAKKSAEASLWESGVCSVVYSLQNGTARVESGMGRRDMALGSMRGGLWERR